MVRKGGNGEEGSNLQRHPTTEIASRSLSWAPWDSSLRSEWHKVKGSQWHRVKGLTMTEGERARNDRGRGQWQGRKQWQGNGVDKQIFCVIVTYSIPYLIYDVRLFLTGDLTKIAFLRLLSKRLFSCHCEARGAEAIFESNSEIASRSLSWAPWDSSLRSEWHKVKGSQWHRVRELAMTVGVGKQSLSKGKDKQG